uniref:Uncharacterized protein n=1 Tax=viral metagenome TaxID=1070528 RepID=A0A6H2A2P6_9ZZZZ
MKKGDESIYPTMEGKGISKREFYAIQAMNALLSQTHHPTNPRIREIAEISVEMADALITELNKS